MNRYYINLKTDTNPNHNNEVHAEGCYRMPTVQTQYLGYFDNGIQAVQAAKRMGFYRADGCALCCPEAHKA